ncbi:integrating conjugative element protein [Azotobacter vinelandii]|uniref:integrating conjugative element protein n=1 Tax=Azotobacter vinelandii TaxID=354 RepID=UPI000773E061|nr:integrating conjugative element protein [Azotobacter vinelandii]
MLLAHRWPAFPFTLCAFCCLVSVAPPTQAQPQGPRPALTVLGDLGGEPARPYLVAIEAAGVPEEEGIQFARTTPYSVADLLPVETPSLSPGRVEDRVAALAIPTSRGPVAPTAFPPLFIVGDDPLSLEWLALRRDRLAEIGATGLAVNVATEAGLQELIEASGGLRIDPAPGNDLASRLNLEHYPVLITRQSAGVGIEQ